jgi:hypothetical protein
VIETGGPERFAQVLGEAVVVPEDPARDDCMALARQADPDRQVQVLAQPVGHRADSPAPSDLLPLPDREHDVDALAAEPSRLVEPAALVRVPGPLDDRERLQAGALGRSPARGEPEEDALADGRAAEPLHRPEGAQVERAPAGRARDDDDRAAGAPVLGGEQAAVEGVEPGASEPEAGEREGRRRQGQTGTGRGGDRGRRQRDRRDGHEDRRGPEHERGCEARAERGGEDVMWIAGERGRHGTARSRRASTRFGPIPGTASSSSTDRNAPCFSRWSTIFCAVTGPTPGRASSSAAVALFR